ncbi:hypothetical protein JOL79_11580 [Microbispora sp. RL4-1S]|uniref:Uncharacterized protein n=1 Tax=Microbispora oryzae TaxID=2806554 RepID=A0A941AHT8_9ACTN|nr:hypothetical protein [Microbispora oryzae]MBP2704455.1 hypothetical protein [Microbispora oryzae]
MASSEALAVRLTGTARHLEEVVAEAARAEFAAELAATFDAMRPRTIEGAAERVMDETLQMVSRTIRRLAGVPEVP